jgi:putative PIN family toxin of toxin-antitoxin system
VKVFLDTNVLVSAFATRGLSADLFELVAVEHELLTGRRVLQELEKALRTKLRLPPGRCAEVVEFLANEATAVIDEAVPPQADVDEDDRLVLGEALAGNADVFVTGDAALVKLKTVMSMRIVTPRQLWELLRSDEQGGR